MNGHPITLKDALADCDAAWNAHIQRPEVQKAWETLAHFGADPNVMRNSWQLLWLRDHADPKEPAAL